MFNPNEHMMTLKGRDYLQVAWRLVWFRDSDNGCGVTYGLETELLEHGEDWAVFRARITDPNGRVVSTGHGSESARDFGDYLEKAETKAVGRALAMLGFGTQFAADELDEGERIVDSPINRKPKAPKAEEPVVEAPKICICEECGKPIRSKVDAKKKFWSSEDIANATKAKFGKALCEECGKKAKDG